MKALRQGRHLWRALILPALLALFQSQAWAQCAMCRTALEGSSSGAAMAKSLNLGIIVLLIPPVAIFCAIFATAYKKGKEPTGIAKDNR